MKNFEIARLFDLMADLLEIKGENPFRVGAYRRAAQNLESLTEDVATLAEEDRLETIPGIGKDLAGKITEYLETGKIETVEAAKKEIPAGVVALMNVPGVGPKTAKLLYERAKVHDVARLEELARAGKLRGLPGIGPKTESNILKGITVVRRGQERMLFGRALPLGQELVEALEHIRAVKQISLAGSIRRRRETAGDIDILVTSSQPEKVMEAFTGLPQVADVLERGGTKASIRHREGIQVDLRVVESQAFGAALVYFTGSKQHNIRIREMAQKRGLKISEYGVFSENTGRRVAGTTEEEVYKAIGLPWIPPELREDAGEVEAALKKKLPRLVELDDIRGDLHAHTEASDGHHTIEALVEAAARRGYEYVIVSDHSKSATVAGGLTVDELLAHVKKIREVARRHPKITVLAGSECDILQDGAMDYPDKVLAQLDVVVAAVHSRFKQPRTEMTRRICRALENPYVNILAHPTGRLIGSRDPYDVDLDEVFQAAKRHGKAIEINSYPERLDLNDVHARRAGELGVLIAINTDTHFLDHLENMTLGVATARRGWTEAARVINTWPVRKLLQWAHAGRGAGRPRAGARSRK
ncbi:MAG TPA: DNA polymerase/3'-5' exonuclease PolX [Methylomirabilota bacterium]|nr:DNA polymerase/3'-5' exonuclease PolX [Methylomirabilota bacterium]